MPKPSLAGLVVLYAGVAWAQSPAPPKTPVSPGGWHQVQGLGPHSRVLIKADKQSAVCFVHFVEEQELTCSRSEDIGSDTITFARTEVKSIKLARGGTLGGLALGLTDRVAKPADDLFAGTVIYQR